MTLALCIILVFVLSAFFTAAVIAYLLTKYFPEWNAQPPADPASAPREEKAISPYPSPLPNSVTGPRIAFCITCKGRTQHIKETLPRNLADNADYDNCVFVLLDYDSQDGLKEYVMTHHSADIASGRLAFYKHANEPVFRMAHAKNMAHRCGILEGAEILVNLDADNFAGYSFASYISEQLKGEENTFLWAKMIKGVLPRGINGRIVVSTNAYLLAGGYDEQFHTWSHDDKDFNLRLRRLGFLGKQIHPRFLDAVRHNDKMRFKDYPEANVTNYEERVEWLMSSDVTIANFGNIGCGSVDKYTVGVVTGPIYIDPMPTRIFGIGMHKTATTSLHHAMRILGFNSAHWTSAHWAKAIWTDMKTYGRSSDLEKHYHMCDLPIPMLFRELDQAYPGSKFIFTILDEETWVTAAEIHWSTRNRFRAMWDSDPFTHKVHQELYGQRTFDREVFLARYRKHNADVFEWFKDRPQDILVMNMSAGDSKTHWNLLCAFVGKPVPTVDYPHSNPNGDMWMSKV